MARLGWRNCKDQSPQLWLFEPPRKRPFEDPRPAGTQPPSGDDEQAAPSGLVGSRDKGGQCSMGLGLRHSMQIESCLDFVQTALQPLGVGAVDPGEAIEARWRPCQGLARVRSSGRSRIRCRCPLRRKRQPAATQRLYISNRFLPHRTITPRARRVARSVAPRLHFPTPARLRQEQYGDAEAHVHQARCVARYPPSAMDR